MIENVRDYFIKISENYFHKEGYDYWNNHIKYVVQIATSLAEKYGADKEVVEISAILHDVAKPLEIRENESHNIVGADIAGEKLSNLGLENDKIEKIKKCIINHSGIINDKNISIEEWCVRNADILSIFNNITIFYYLAFKEYSFDYESGRDYVKKMINQKINDLDKNLYDEYKEKIQSLLNSI